MNPMKNIRGILFDKDGTLLDFNRTWLAPYQRAAKRLQAHFGARADAAKLLARGGFIAETQSWRVGAMLVSASNQQILRCWSEAIGETIDGALLEDIETIFSLPDDHHAPTVDDLPGLLDALRNAGTPPRKLGVATMDCEANARKMLRALKCETRIDFVCGADSGFGVKPGGGMARAFCRACNLRAEQVIVVGDSPLDIAMARDAGVAQAIGVSKTHSMAHSSDAHSGDPLDADLVVNDIGELPRILGDAV